MIVEARVVSLDGDYAIIELARSTGGCGRCHETGGCGGGGVLGQFFGLRSGKFRTLNQLSAKAGETLWVELDDSAYVRAALGAYALPSAALVVGAMATGFLLPEPSDISVFIGALLGLAFGTIATALVLRRAALFPVLTRRPKSCDH